VRNLAILTTILIAETEANLSETSSSKEDDHMMLVDITDKLLQHTARVVADIEGGTKDCTIKIPDLFYLLLRCSSLGGLDPHGTTLPSSG
jgi:hypothetical protein